MNHEAKDARSVAELLEVLQSGGSADFLFFWGHTPKKPDDVDQSCLSNWFPAEFSVGGIVYRTTEHFMMAEKAKLFADESMRQQILAANSPRDAKRLGRKVSGFDEEIWNKHRFEIVVTGNENKFSQNQKLGQFLKLTETKVLVEASPMDRIWGIGMGKDHVNAQDPSKWNGLNLLGFALMEVRERLIRMGS